MKGEIGIVNTINTTNRTARVHFPAKNDTVSAELQFASHIESLNVNDQVICIYLNNTNTDGYIICVLEGS